MSDAEILADAPKGATHVDCDGTYYKHDSKYPKYYLPDLKEWTIIPTDEWYIEFRSLADLKALVDRDKRIAELEDKIHALNLQTESHLTTVTHSAEQLQRRLTEISPKGGDL